MPRGGMKIKPVKAAQVGISEISCPDDPLWPTKAMRSKTSLIAGLSTPSMRPRSLSMGRLTTLSSDPPPPLPQPPEAYRQEFAASTMLAKQANSMTRPELPRRESGLRERRAATSHGLSLNLIAATEVISSVSPGGEEESVEDALEGLRNFVFDEAESTASSTHSRDDASIFFSDSASMFSYDSASIYSSASSIRSSGASVYSLEDEIEPTVDTRGQQLPKRTRVVAAKRQEPQDAASRERSTLARKAAMFKNSRLRPGLPGFSTSLLQWSMITRAAHASQDCYDSQTRTRQGLYTPADTSKDTKAMIVDDQLIDNTRLVIVSIRGTECKSLTDWAVNKASHPTKPSGFFDDERNECHAGFLQVTKAMVAQIAAQLKSHPASSERPALLITGHSAGGAIAAMLYSHMLSRTVSSDLTTLAHLFPTINCITFGAPPISVTPLLKHDHVPGVFISFANEGDPVLRLSSGAYVKSLIRLVTVSTPAPTSVTPVAAPVKVVRRSRGGILVRKAVTAPDVAWEDMPHWPTPASPFKNAGEVVLLRDYKNGSAMASCVTPEDLEQVIFGNLAEHTIALYIRRLRECALTAITGRL